MSERDPLIRKIADANPVPEDVVRGSGTSPAAEHILEDVIAGRVAVRRVPRRHLATFAGAGTLLTVIAVVAFGLLDRRAATAEELLREAAVTAAAAQPAPERGPYVYMKTVSDQLTTSDAGGAPWSVILPVVEETWIAPDGSGRIRSVIGKPRFLGPRDRQRWEAAGSPEFPAGVSDKPFSSGELVYEDASSLPNDPVALRAKLSSQVASEGVPTNVGVFLRVGLLLGRADASPELRAALFRVASTLPGIDAVAARTDPLGRDGVGVRMRYMESGARISVVLVFDPRTSRVLSQEQFLLSPAAWVDAIPGTRVSFVAFVASDVRESFDGRVR